MGSFLTKMQENFAAGRYSCAGLDPVDSKIPAYLMERRADDPLEAWRTFLYTLVTTAGPYAGAFKPNAAFYLAKGPRGLQLLVDLCTVIRTAAPHALLILDMKVGDIGNTNHGYVEFAYEFCKADAVTVHPYMGSEAMEPFLKDPARGVFVLCKTSNEGSGELQDLVLYENCLPVSVHIAKTVNERWNQNKNCGLVAGATYPAKLLRIREVAPELPLLIPGIGTQRGDLKATVEAAVSAGSAPFVVNQSSSFMYASKDETFAQAGADVLAKTNTDIAAIMAQFKEKIP